MQRCPICCGAASAELTRQQHRGVRLPAQPYRLADRIATVDAALAILQRDREALLAAFDVDIKVAAVAEVGDGADLAGEGVDAEARAFRSEERRVGKGGRAR